MPRTRKQGSEYAALTKQIKNLQAKIGRREKLAPEWMSDGRRPTASVASLNREIRAFTREIRKLTKERVRLARRR